MYILALIALLVAYISVIFAMKYMKNTKLFNGLFVCIVAVCYLLVMLTVYLDVGFADWNFQNTLPTANVSPLMFCLTIFVLFLPKKARRYCLLLVSLLSVGMLASTIFGCIYNASIGYKFHFHFLLDYIAHVALSLWGIYLVKTNQVKVENKSCIVSMCMIFAYATLMLILNVIFDTAFFGLSLNGKHNIYNMVITSNSYLSALLYYAGLFVVLIAGMFLQKYMSKKPIDNYKN